MILEFNILKDHFQKIKVLRLFSRLNINNVKGIHCDCVA